jgi:hypothetical protein
MSTPPAISQNGGDVEALMQNQPYGVVFQASAPRCPFCSQATGTLMGYKICTDADADGDADVAADADEIDKPRNPAIIRNTVPTEAIIRRLLLRLLSFTALSDLRIFIVFHSFPYDVVTASATLPFGRRRSSGSGSR